MVEAQFIEGAVAELKKALRRHGEYTMVDKGTNEVMDTSVLIKQLREMPSQVAARLLEGIYQQQVMGQEYRTTNFAEQLVCDLVSDLDDAPDAWWNDLMTSSILRKCY